MSKHGPPVAWTKAKRRKREMVERKQRVLKYQDKIDLLRALMRMHEERGNKSEAVRINARIRVIEQQVRYIGIDPNEQLLQ
jgi:hypothetical protein